MSKYINIQKDIGEYDEKIVAGLSLRGLVGICVAGVLSLGLAALAVFVFGVEVNAVAIPIMLVAVGVYVLSFMKPLGMTTEKAIPLIWNQHFGTTKLVYRSSRGAQLSEVCKKHRERELERLKKEKDKYAKNESKEYRRLRRGRGVNCGEILIPATSESQETQS